MLLVGGQLKILTLILYDYLTILEYAQASSMLCMGIKEVLVLKELPNSSIGDVEIGQSLLKKINLFGNVILALFDWIVFK